MIITKRISIFISAFILSMCLFGVISSHAETYNSNNVYYICSDSTNRYKLCSFGSMSSTSYHTVYCTTSYFAWNSSQGIIYCSYKYFNSISEAVAFFEDIKQGNSFTWDNTYSSEQWSSPYLLIILNNPKNYTFTTWNMDGGTIYDSYEDYEDYNNSSWFDIMWDTFKDYLGNPVPFEWIKNLYDRLWGDPDNTNSIIENTEIEAPTIAPTPTAIPYQTIVVPKVDPVTGDTYYTYEYHYNNPSGTPIVATAPPPQPTDSAGGGNGGGDYSPIGGEPYSIPNLPWINTTITIGDDDVNILDDFGNGIDSINTIASQYQDGMNTATETFGFLPTDWLILIGVCSAIILIGGIVSRFLS